MQWWCSAQTAAWSWEWTPYPGVWLFVGALAVAYWRLVRSDGFDGILAGGRDPGAGDAADPARWRVLAFGAGLLLIWAVLDWPIGPLGASYLASVHMGQLLVLSLVAPALLLMGLPRRVLRAPLGTPGGVPLLRAVTHPVAALVIYNAVVVGTHVPAVLDTLVATQPGMLAMDMAWLLAGVVFWWPVLAPEPEREWFNPFFQMGYLFLNTVPATVPYSFLVFADFPIYRTYELAPPIPGIPTIQDQRIAGLLMKVGGGVILWTAITILFFRWYRDEESGLEVEPSAAGSGGTGG